MSELIPGKWYKASYSSKVNIYLKYSNTEIIAGITWDYKRFHGEAITMSGMYRKSAVWASPAIIRSMRTLENLDEIKKYLPEGHPDLAVPDIKDVISEFLKRENNEER